MLIFLVPDRGEKKEVREPKHLSYRSALVSLSCDWLSAKLEVQGGLFFFFVCAGPSILAGVASRPAGLTGLGGKVRHTA